MLLRCNRQHTEVVVELCADIYPRHRQAFQVRGAKEQQCCRPHRRRSRWCDCVPHLDGVTAFCLSPSTLPRSSCPPWEREPRQPKLWRRADNTIHDQSHNLIHNLVQDHLRNAKSDPQVESLKLCAICCQLLENSQPWQKQEVKNRIQAKDIVSWEQNQPFEGNDRLNERQWDWKTKSRKITFLSSSWDRGWSLPPPAKPHLTLHCFELSYCSPSSCPFQEGNSFLLEFYCCAPSREMRFPGWRITGTSSGQTPCPLSLTTPLSHCVTKINFLATKILFQMKILISYFE